MTERAEQFARLMSAENGKSLRDARGEATYAAEFFRWYAEEAVRIEGTLMRAPSGANKILDHAPADRGEPAGHAVELPGRDGHPQDRPGAGGRVPGGAQAGRGHPADRARAGRAAAARRACPTAWSTCVTTSKPGPAVAAMLNDSRVRKLSFTGSTEVGRLLLGQAAKSVMSCSMELGGNAPFIVFEDADIDAAVEGALIAKLRNGGEACTAANRFYVHEAVADQFNATFAERMKAMVVGPGLDESTEIGPLVNEATRSKVAGLVDGADRRRRHRGHRRRRAGPARATSTTPTLLDGVPSDAAILDTEIFGPVAPVVRFTDEADAIRWANATEFGLVSYVYTQDLRRGLRVSEALEAGMIGLNRGLVSDPAAPFGGVKQSGLGREGAHEGLLEYTETKYIATDW